MILEKLSPSTSMYIMMKQCDDDVFVQYEGILAVLYLNHTSRYTRLQI